MPPARESAPFAAASLPGPRAGVCRARVGVPIAASARAIRRGAVEVAAGDGLARVLTGAGAGAQRVRGGVLGEAADVLPLQREHALGVHLERGLAGPAHRVVAGLVQVGHLADEVVVAELARLDAARAECIGHGAGVPGEVRGHAPQHPPLRRPTLPAMARYFDVHPVDPQPRAIGQVVDAACATAA